MPTVVVPLSTPLARRLSLLETIALEGSQAAVVQRLARSLCDRGGAYPSWWWIRPLVSVQSCPVVEDPPGVDEYRDAVTTLAQGGDCANKSALLVALYIAARPFCGPVGVRLVWEHCGTSCAFDHVRVDVRIDGVTFVADPLRAVSPGARAVSWAPQQTWPGRWL